MVLGMPVNPYASTGPRPRGRGNIISSRCLFHPKPKLQRGRARAGAEIWPVIVVHDEQHRASTGPRPRGRGNYALGRRAHVLLRASTGPRPRGRGNALCVIDGCVGNSCFNGAAPARARKFVPHYRHRSTAHQASTGPRPRGRGNPMEICPPRPSRRSFNGAAPARARKSNKIFKSVETLCCFNGAAPARARK